MLLSAVDLYKNFGTKQLLEGASLFINENDKIGIIGINGTGKSTLLRIIAGMEESDKGEITKAQNLKISFLAQNPNMNGSFTVLQQIKIDFKEDLAVFNEYEAKAMLNSLGVTDYDATLSTMSGGERKRVALVSALIRPCDLLILDEPTNHLDSFMVSFLEDYLKKFKGAVLMITHDRYFLERVCNRICLLERGTIQNFDANYSKFLEIREERRDMELASERKRQSTLRREREWLLRGARARGTKSKERIERYWDLAEKEAPSESKEVEISTVSSRLGKKIIEINNVSKAYDKETVITDFSYNVMRNDRIGIIGKNGAGKSTLLNIITGTIPPDSGSVEIGETVKIGYFSQSSESLPENYRVYDYIKEISNEIKTDEGVLSASQMLEKFLFTSDLQYSKIGILSGGEKRRLNLLAILVTAPNVLVLDEPTNDLDIETLMILEDYIESFSGAVLTVSHDRYFLDKIAQKIFNVDSSLVTVYNGNYSDFLIKTKEDKEDVEVKTKNNKETKAKQFIGEKKLKMTFKEQREFETIDEDMEKLSEEIEIKEKETEKASSDYQRLQELAKELENLKNALSEKEERWLYLTDLSEKIANQ